MEMQIGHNGFETLRFSQVGVGYTAVQHRKVDMCSYEHPLNSQLRKSWPSYPLPRAEGRVFSILVVAIWLRPGPVTRQKLGINDPEPVLKDWTSETIYSWSGQ
jgi:hypothetical protein